MTFDLNLVGLCLGFCFPLASSAKVWPGSSAWDFQQFCKHPLTLDVVFPFWTFLLEALFASFFSLFPQLPPALSFQRGPSLICSQVLLSFLPQASS